MADENPICCACNLGIDPNIEAFYIVEFNSEEVKTDHLCDSCHDDALTGCLQPIDFWNNPGGWIDDMGQGFCGGCHYIFENPHDFQPPLTKKQCEYCREYVFCCEDCESYKHKTECLFMHNNWPLYLETTTKAYQTLWLSLETFDIPNEIIQHIIRISMETSNFRDWIIQ